jgi:chemotaxis family two-component system sensor kinase Cph1
MLCPGRQAFFGYTGVVLFDEVCKSVGSVPSDAFLIKLRDWLIARPGETLFATHTLPLLYPPSREWKSMASGVMAVQILPEHGCYALWFRPEVISTVTWAGDPNNPVSVEDGHARLSPRKSEFAFRFWICWLSED